MSRAVNAIYARYTDRIEPFGIDESWLDMTQTWRLFGSSPAGVADAVRRAVKAETGLTISVGVSFNKVFAKLGSDYKKPDATTVISRENWRSIVWPLPVGDLLYVGGAAQKLLGQYGVKTIGQLAACKKETLETLMGKMGTQLYEYANGLDSAPVRARLDAEPVKSVGNGTPFPQFNGTGANVRFSMTAPPSPNTSPPVFRCAQASPFWRTPWPPGCGGRDCTPGASRSPSGTRPSMTAPGKSSFPPPPISSGI